MDKREESMMFSKALALASEKHAGQIRVDETPYILHPIRVAKMIADAGYDIRYQIAGLFHDLLENTDVSEDAIRIYGEDILEAVKLVSKHYCEDETQYINNILKNHMASVIKNADLIDNLWEACYTDAAFQKKYLEDSEKYRGKFSEALDLSIDKLDLEMRNIGEKERKYPKYGYSYMELYQDSEKRLAIEQEERIKQLLKINETCEKPDRTNPNLVYFKAYNFYYCAYEYTKPHYVEKVWLLTEAGWIPQKIDLYECYGYDLDEIDRDFVLSKFRKRKLKGEILDFVSEDEI